MEGNELEIFKINCEALVDAKYQEQIKILIGYPQQAILERDAKVVTVAHRDLMVEQTAMHHRFQQYTYSI